ncbi:MAG: hypothetical protein DCF26_16545 [Burkholderiales bacterium]|nr:MAG: hypothetical protein DCF26_16545 [Burkholderiales bacterium]
MSFTTRCPACGTTFRIVADQLKISEGWVRCGHCADVFDATLYLEPWVPGTPAPASPDRPTEPALPQAELTIASDPQEDELVTRPPALLPDDVQKAPPEDADFGTELQRFAAAKAVAEAAAAVADKAQRQVPTSKTPSGSVPLTDPDTDEVRVEPPAVPGFVRQAQQRAFWQSPGVRAGLFLVVVLLGALLAGQWALHERDRLAAWEPRLLPLLQQACAPLGCTVGPVRNIDAILIDSSALVRRLGNFHSFDLVLKNTADMALALPALELSLTDTRDQVISRRVFLPEEWPDAPAVVPANSSLNVSFRLALSVGEATPMAGYRALVFYP